MGTSRACKERGKKTDQEPAMFQELYNYSYSPVKDPLWTRVATQMLYRVQSVRENYSKAQLIQCHSQHLALPAPALHLLRYKDPCVGELPRVEAWVQKEAACHPLSPKQKVKV